MSFVADLRSGKAVAEDVDDWVDTWHDTNGAPYGVPVTLHDYLGFTHDEYGRWLREGDQVLYEIET